VATTRFFYEVKLERTKQIVKRWISCPTLKGKLVLDKVILSTIFKLKIRSSSSSMQDPRFFEFWGFVENLKVPFVETIKVALLNKVCART